MIYRPTFSLGDIIDVSPWGVEPIAMLTVVILRAKMRQQLIGHKWK
jgi:hypothetical protein